MAKRVQPYRQQWLAGLCLAALVPVLAGCGPTAEQFEARQSAPQPRTTSGPAAPPAPAPPSPEPEPSPSSSEPVAVQVSGEQAGMAPQVQESCQWLLRRDAAPFPGAGACVSAAMVAGLGARQTVTTTASWLPPGTYSMEFRTAPGFGMILDGQEGDLRISVDGPARTLRTGEAEVTADPGGGPEEAYAAVLVDAAELTANPERLGRLLDSAGPAAIDYGADLDGVPVTKVTGVLKPQEPGGFSGSVVLLLDELYRPLLIEYAGTTRGIASSIRASVTGWGSSGPLR